LCVGSEAPEDPTDLDWEIRDLLPEEDAAVLLAEKQPEAAGDAGKYTRGLPSLISGDAH